jgi:hypothetical protein
MLALDKNPLTPALSPKGGEGEEFELRTIANQRSLCCKDICGVFRRAA